MRVPWKTRRSNQSIIQKINPVYTLKGLMIKPKLQYFGHLIQKADSLGKILILGKTEGKTRSRRQRIRWLDIITDSMDLKFSKVWETAED